MEQLQVNPFLVQRKQMVESTETMTDMFITAYEHAKETQTDEEARGVATGVLVAILKSSVEE